MHRSPRPCPAGSESSRPGRWQPEDVRSQQGFQSLNLSRGTCYRAKFICIERGSTHEPSVDIRHAEQGLGIIRLDTAAIDNLYLLDRKSTRLNSSHVRISYAVFCLKK